MNIAVCIKQVADTEARLLLDATGEHVLEDELTWIINPHDESAIEAALQLKETHHGTVTLIALGPSRVAASLRQGLAMGADRAIHLRTRTMPDDSQVVAEALQSALYEGGFDLVLTGQVAIDGGGHQVPQRLGVLLEWPCVTAVERLKIDSQGVTAMRSVEGGEEEYNFALPAIVGVNRRLGEPRYPSFRGIMQARKKHIDIREAALSKSALFVQRFHLPPGKSRGQTVPFEPAVASHVARLLRQEAKII